MSVPNPYTSLLGAIHMDTWAEDANCIGKAHILESDDDTAARALCKACPVIRDCTRWVFSLGRREDPGGFAAGMTQPERDHQRRRNAAALAARTKRKAAA